jgi:hypothetical protein
MIGAAISLALAAALLVFKRKRLHIIRAAASASEAQLDLIYKLVGQCGSHRSRGCVLARTNQRAPSDACMVTLPDWLNRFPWSGRTIAVDAGRDVAFRFTYEPVSQPQFRGKIFQAVGVPRIRPRSGKMRTMYSPQHFVSSSEVLKRALEGVCPRYPVDLLAYLLCSGAETFEFEPINCARIGGRPAWVQDPEFQVCDECNNRMTLIFQVPGTMLAADVYSRGTFYLFGCKRHPERTKTVAQYT